MSMVRRVRGDAGRSHAGSAIAQTRSDGYYYLLFYVNT